jgi:hypothetical protein
MKHIKEFEDQDLQDMMGNLERVGHERLKGWYIGTINEDGYFGISVILAHNDSEVEEILREKWRWAKNYMPEKIGNAYKGKNNLFDNFLDALMSNVLGAEEIKFYQMYKNLAIRDSTGKKPGLLSFPGYNPILASEKLDEIFIDIRQKMSAEKDDFEEESEENLFVKK